MTEISQDELYVLDPELVITQTVGTSPAMPDLVDLSAAPAGQHFAFPSSSISPPSSPAPRLVWHGGAGPQEGWAVMGESRLASQHWSLGQITGGLPGSEQEFSAEFDQGVRCHPVFPAPLPVLLEAVGHYQVAQPWGQALAPDPWGTGVFQSN